MYVDTETILSRTKLFAQIFEDMKYRDGWLTFDPEFAEFVAEQNIAWWPLYGNQAQLQDAMALVLFSPEQARKFIASPAGRQDITKAALSRVEYNREWGSSFEADLPNVLGMTPATAKQQKATMERINGWLSALVANLYNYISVMVYGISLCQLVADAMTGNDLALVKAIHVDRTLLNLPYFQQRLARAQLTGDVDFLDMLGYRIRNPLLRSKPKHPKLRMVFAILQDQGLLESSPYGELLDICRKVGVYAGTDVNAFRKSLGAYRQGQLKRKDF
ncbi:MAG: hypothetical protein KGJ56_07080 [Gammaproteobacteria bacterium]|nr:hypothetical protein [Gammaproteobacteria bacterium]